MACVTKCSESQIYIGTKAGGHLRHSLQSAKHTIKIVSPYINQKFLEELLIQATNGLNVILITSEDLYRQYLSQPYNRDIFTILIEQQRHIDQEAQQMAKDGILYHTKIVKFLAVLMLTSLLCYPVIPKPLGLLPFFILALLLVIFFKKIKHYKQMPIYSYTYKSPIKIKIIRDEQTYCKLMHSKIYVIDDIIAYIGSVNFTYRAFEQNYETIVKIIDNSAITDISSEVDRLYNETQFKYIDISVIGRSLYPEPAY